ncbi:MAG: hypothetical protein GTN78_03645 [Gemmatimonadales bacterium]|nr:hypothetical protein [Gemmatimonadales bacterium]NIQ99279.1 hypothetical protein [Gemmatimonadales bacterium]
MRTIWKGRSRPVTPVAEREKYPKRLETAEDERLKERRRLLGMPSPAETGVAGVALSGGGIRSATLSLGLFQVLARRRLLGYVDYLSTVSGGGYFGSFFGGLFCRHRAGENRLDDVQQTLEDANSWEVGFLRENGRYLAPSGFGDLLMATAIVLRNWASVSFLIALTLFTAMVGLNLLRWAADQPEFWPWQLYATSSFLFLWLSPYLWLPLALLVVLAVPLGAAYWLVPYPKASFLRQLAAWAQPVLVVAGGAVGFAWAPSVPFSGATRWVLLGLAVAAALAVIFRVLAGAAPSDAPIGGMRTRLSRWLTVSLVAVAVTLLIALIDTLGQSAFRVAVEEAQRRRFLATLSVLFGGLSGVVAFSRKLSALFAGEGNGKRLSVPRNLLVFLVAFALLGFGLVLVSALAHGLTWLWTAPASTEPPGAPMVLLVVLVAGTVLAILMGQVWRFVNRSTMHPFYEARLRRAYLGASNPGRRDGSVPVVKGDPGDRILMDRYHPEERGGPLHLVNITVNETVSGESQVQQQDRKGMGMAVGPAGISVARRHHAVWAADGNEGGNPASSNPGGGPGHDEVFHVFPPRLKEVKTEPLDLSEWVAISGAAVTTGLGSRTSLGLSLLTGFFNIRLGYWWDSGVKPNDRGRVFLRKRSWSMRLGGLAAWALPVQSSLADEWLARFHGVARRRWYLSDGGHFENMGGYELIRRRLPFIVVCDHEQDADYGFGGLANLVRKARIDFDTEIEFLSTEQLEAVVDESLHGWIGTRDQLRRRKGRRPYSRAHAALAHVKYLSEKGTEVDRHGVLLYIKPTLLGDEPTDLIEYHASHPAYPHESTGDQFFDEAQWESYRRLGQQMAARVFGEPAARAKWSPADALMNPAAAAKKFVRLLEAVR